MKIIASNPDGLSSRDIRHALSRIIDIDEQGNESQAFAAVGNLHMSQVVAIACDDDGDMVLVSDHAQQIMEDLGTWEEFISARA